MRERKPRGCAGGRVTVRVLSPYCYIVRPGPPIHDVYNRRGRRARLGMQML